MKVAVIGAGAAGISCAWLLAARHAVTLYEKEGRLGGHTHTVDVHLEDQVQPVDTGFIVLNNRTYPTLHHLFRQWGVKVRYTDMSFGFECESSGLSYAGTGLRGLFADPLNLVRPAFLKNLWQLLRFAREGLGGLKKGAVSEELTLGDFLSRHGFSHAFARDYVLPMGAAIWSTAPGKILQFPARTFLQFFANHGLLNLMDRPRWQTVVGGSRAYIDAFLEKFEGRVVLNAGLQCVWQKESGPTLQFCNGCSEEFDAVVFAAHADQSLRLLANPNALQTQLLSAFGYQGNRTVLHQDPAFLPQNKRAGAAWNFRRELVRNNLDPVTLTYDMNRLQGFESKRPCLVSLNFARPIRRQRILKELHYEHPQFDQRAIKAQRELGELNTSTRIQFCGSYFGFGFHEDAVLSGTRAAANLGCPLEIRDIG